jgi:hypothetical protein
MSEWVLKILPKSGDFQAEYEGSIPFTRKVHSDKKSSLYGACLAGFPRSLMRIHI